ncbi:stalk domain-containing protein [Anaerotignum sp.]
MKKKLAALLCGVMCTGAFTGCSSTELAYLKMSRDLLDTMESCKVEGTIRADVDFDAMQGFVKDVAKATKGELDGASLYTEGMPTGKKAVTVSYDMNMNISTLEYDMAFDVSYEGKKYDLGTLYYSLNDGVYVTSDTIWGVYQMAGDMMEAEPNGYMFSDAFAKDLKAVLAEDPYIELVSMEDMTGVDMEGAMPQNNMGDLYDAVMTFYEDVLDGFETGMVKEIPGGYAIQANGQEVAQLLVDLLDFVAKNPDQVIDATEAYMNAVMEQVQAGTPEETAAAKQEMAEFFAEARASQDDFVEAAADMSTFLKETMQDKSVAAVLNSFTYKAEVKKTDNGFNSTASYDMTNKGKKVLSVTTDSVMKKSAVKVTMPKKAVSMDDLNGKLAALENKYNPVNGVTMSWGWDGTNSEADLYKMREEAVYFGNDYEWTDLIVKDGRAYLPLRVICDALGENVGWENATKTPYVLQDGQRIDMKGLLQDGRAFVGVRDFEKLGYTVSYTSEDGYKEAVIAR